MAHLTTWGLTTWGLMDNTVPAFAMYAGRPLENRRRHLPDLDDSAPETFADEFEQLTGQHPLVEWADVAVGA